MRALPDRPTNTIKVKEEDRVDFDEAILLKDDWKTESDDIAFEVERIVDVRSGRQTLFGRVHRQFLVY